MSQIPITLDLPILGTFVQDACPAVPHVHMFWDPPTLLEDAAKGRRLVQGVHILAHAVVEGVSQRGPQAYAVMATDLETFRAGRVPVQQREDGVYEVDYWHALTGEVVTSARADAESEGRET